MVIFFTVTPICHTRSHSISSTQTAIHTYCFYRDTPWTLRRWEAGRGKEVSSTLHEMIQEKLNEEKKLTQLSLPHRSSRNSRYLSKIILLRDGLREQQNIQFYPTPPRRQHPGKLGMPKSTHFWTTKKNSDENEGKKLNE